MVSTPIGRVKWFEPPKVNGSSRDLDCVHGHKLLE